MPAPLYPNVACLNVIELMRTDLALCKVHLFQNDFIPSLSTVPGDLTEADFGGYPSGGHSVTALLPAYLDPAGGASARIATVQFDADGSSPDNIIYGFYVISAAPGSILYMVGRFDTPIPMASVGDSIPIDIVFNFGAGQ